MAAAEPEPPVGADPVRVRLHHTFFEGITGFSRWGIASLESNPAPPTLPLLSSNPNRIGRQPYSHCSQALRPVKAAVGMPSSASAPGYTRS